MVERSDWERAIEEEEDMSHDSKAEKRMEVDMPPRTRPIRSVGSQGNNTQMQAIVYVKQKARQIFLRPLYWNQLKVKAIVGPEDVLLVCPYSN
jgi:hypothetical protein